MDAAGVADRVRGLRRARSCGRCSAARSARSSARRSTLAVGAADRHRLQLPAQARHRARHDLARHGHLRVDRQHLHLAAEHLLVAAEASGRLAAWSHRSRSTTRPRRSSRRGEAAERLGERFLVYRDEEGRQHIHALAATAVGDDRAPRGGRHLDPVGPGDVAPARRARAARRRVDGLRRRPVAERHVGQRAAPRRPPAARRRRPACKSAGRCSPTATRCRSGSGRRWCPAS